MPLKPEYENEYLSSLVDITSIPLRYPRNDRRESGPHLNPGSTASSHHGVGPGTNEEPSITTTPVLSSRMMNDDGWYTSFVPRAKAQATPKSPSKRRETVNVGSILIRDVQIPTMEMRILTGRLQEGIRVDAAPVDALLKPVVEEDLSKKVTGPPPATVARRAKSYSDFYDVVRAHIKKENKLEREKQRKRHRQKQIKNELEFGTWYQGVQNGLADASLEEYQYGYSFILTLSHGYTLMIYAMQTLPRSTPPSRAASRFTALRRPLRPRSPLLPVKHFQSR